VTEAGALSSWAGHPGIKNIAKKRFMMHIKFMKWFATTMLFLGVLGFFGAESKIGLNFVVCIAALLVFSQAVSDKRWTWAVAFLALSIIYNPVSPLLFSKKVFLWLDLMSLMTFLISLVALKQRPKLTLASITNQSARSESL
jgi:hypothetical protein